MANRHDAKADVKLSALKWRLSLEDDAECVVKSVRSFKMLALTLSEQPFRKPPG